MRDRVRRQLELEDESRGLGASRYRASRPLPWRQDTSSTQEETSLPPGKQLLKACIVPMEQATAEWCSMIANGGAGRRHAAHRLLSACDPDQVAYLTARVVINSMSGKLGLTATAFAVAAALIEHIEMVRLQKALGIAQHWDGGSGTGVPILLRKPRTPKITVDNLCDRVLSAEEQDTLFKALDKRVQTRPLADWRRYKVFIRFLLETGCRLSEALNLNLNRVPSQFDTVNGVTFVLFPRYTTKNNRPRRLPLTDGLVADIEAIKGMTGEDGFLFPYDAKTAWDRWNSLRKELGPSWKDVKLHTFRHTRLTELAKRMPIHKVSLWAGHSDIKITMKHYTHLQSEDLLECLTAIPVR